MSKGSRNRSATKAYWSSSYWNKPASNDAKPASDGGEAVKEIMRLVTDKCTWQCECNSGTCSFATKADALDGSHGKFCGMGATVKRKGAK